MFSNNFEYLSSNGMNHGLDVWFCLDNPEKAKLKQHLKSNDYTSLYIEAYFCQDKPECFNQTEI